MQNGFRLAHRAGLAILISILALPVGSIVRRKHRGRGRDVGPYLCKGGT
jgi:hypothetical protein